MDHIMRAAVDQGAVHERINMVEVIAHPTHPSAEFNFITPRKNTAFVSGQYLQQGITWLRGKRRIPRVHYIDGLFPPPFTQLVRNLNFTLERELPVMLYIPGTLPFVERQGHSELSIIERVSTSETWAQWTSFRRTDQKNIEWISKNESENENASMINPNISRFILRQGGIAVGGARLRITHDTQESSVSGHIEALFVIPPNLDSKWLQPLAHAVLREATEKGCAFVFTFAQTDAERRFWRTLGFVDTSSLLYYVGTTQSPEDS